MKAYMKRVLDINTYINAVIDNRFDVALVEASELDRRIQLELNGEKPADGIRVTDLPLLGVPFSIKDSISVQGMKLTAGLVYRRDEVCKDNAEVVQNLIEAGAIPIVITNVPETMMWYDTENKAFGRTNNPYDLSRIPGGSTGKF